MGVNSQIYSRTGGFMGVSFAIPIDVVMNVYQQIRDKGEVSRGWLGVLIQDVTTELAESFHMSQPHGALVSKVLPDSPAENRPDVGPLMYEPTVLEEVTPNMEMFAEETFGPVLAVYRVSSDEEAIRLANDSPYGLSASVWSRRRSRAEAIARRVMCGAVNVNDGAAAAAGSIEAPMGGMRDSGLGRRHGAEGIRKYTEAQTIAVQRILPLAPPKGVTLEAYAGFITKQLKIMRAFGVR